MPYLILGILFLVFGIYFLKRSKRIQNRHGVHGMTFIILAAVLLLLFFAAIYRLNIL